MSEKEDNTTLSLSLNKKSMDKAREYLATKGTTVEDEVKKLVKHNAKLNDEPSSARKNKRSANIFIINLMQSCLVMVWFCAMILSNSWSMPLIPNVFALVLIAQIIWWPISMTFFDCGSIKWFHKI